MAMMEYQRRCSMIQKVNESGTQSSFLTNWENRKAQDFQHSWLLWKISQHPQ